MNTSERIETIQDAAYRAGLPRETLRGMWAQLAGHTTTGRDAILTRWESCAANWPTVPVGDRVRRGLVGVEYLV